MKLDTVRLLFILLHVHPVQGALRDPHARIILKPLPARRAASGEDPEPILATTAEAVPCRVSVEGSRYRFAVSAPRVTTRVSESLFRDADMWAVRGFSSEVRVHA